MENSKEEIKEKKGKSNVAVIVLLSIAILLLFVVSAIMLVQQSTKQSILVTEKDSSAREHSSNKTAIENIPINNSIYIIGNTNENNVNQAENSIATNNTIPNSSGGEDTIPNSYGGADIINTETTIRLNNVNHKVNVYCECKLINSVEYAPNQYQSVYNNHYYITVDGEECKRIVDVESILPDNPSPSDCFSITKIADQKVNKDYLVIQTFANFISGRRIAVYILDDNLRIIGIVNDDDLMSYSINGESKEELTIGSDYISDYVWQNDFDNTGVAHHIYSIQDGKFVDNIEKVYKDGEYEVSGRS